MGGVVSSAVDFVSAPAKIVGGIANQIPVVGPIAGPVISYMAPGGGLGTALGQIAMNAATGQYGGGGGGGGGGSTETPAPTTPTYGGSITAPSTGGITTPYYSPTYNYGSNAYTVDNTPFDTSKYFIQGGKGTYNLLPQLSNLYGNPDVAARAGTTSANVYNDILNQMKMNQDVIAEQNLQKNFGMQSFIPTAGTPTNIPESFTGADYLKSDIQGGLNEFYPSGSTQTESIPVSYADFGVTPDSTLAKIANYAKQQNNPFFMPYAPEDVKPNPEPYRAPTVMPVSSMPTPEPGPTMYTPSYDVRGPAPRDIAPASVETGGSYRPAEAGSTMARTATEPTPGAFKPVNIRTGGLASLRRKA